MFAALSSADGTGAAALLACAQEFSPRIETQLGGRVILIDVAGLGRIVGDAEAIAAELRTALATCDVGRATGATCLDVPRTACDVARNGTSHVARSTTHVTIVVAPSRIAALLLAIAGRDGVVVPGRTASAVGSLSLSVFETLAKVRNPGNLRIARNLRSRSRGSCALCALAGSERLCGHPGGACTELPTIVRWGLSTLGEVAALPAAALSARLGQMGVVLQRLARGHDTQPLVPVVEETRFESSLDLEWPIDDLQPLSFVLARLLEPLSAALERADRGAAAIVTALTLVRRPEADATRDHVRRLELPAPMRDPRVLRTLILLDLESHPPPAGIDRVAVRIEPTPGRIVQFSLLERAGPQPETIATLVSRLTALMGEGRVGSPVLLDSHAPDACALAPFGQTLRPNPLAPPAGETGQGDSPADSTGGTCLRRFRLPVIARVVMAGDRPVRVTTDRAGIKGGDVQQYAGPWRSSGHWWVNAPRARADADGAWDRDEYDVALGDGAAYRIYRDRHEDRWFVEGILD